MKGGWEVIKSLCSVRDFEVCETGTCRPGVCRAEQAVDRIQGWMHSPNFPREADNLLAQFPLRTQQAIIEQVLTNNNTFDDLTRE